VLAIWFLLAEVALGRNYDEVLLDLASLKHSIRSLDETMDAAAPKIQTASCEVWHDDGDRSFKARKGLAVVDI
jgi:hypothetical protein